MPGFDTKLRHGAERIEGADPHILFPHTHSKNHGPSANWVVFRNDDGPQAAGGLHFDPTEVSLRIFLLNDTLGPRLRFCAGSMTEGGGPGPSQGN